MNALERAVAVEQKALRDMTGLLALPALWAGRDGRTVIDLTFGAIERIVRLDAVLAQVPLLTEEPRHDVLRVRGAVKDAHADPAWHTFLRACQAMPGHSGAQAVLDSPLGSLRVLRLPLGAGDHGGAVWFASSAQDFPDMHEGVFLRAAVSLASAGIHSARLAHEREQANRAKDEFLAMLGHELRNPLAPIVTALHVLKLKHPGGLSREHQIIERQVTHLSRLVEDLLDVTRITRGKVELRREPVDLRQVLTEAIEEVSPLLEQKSHLLTVAPMDFDATVLGDPARLRQVFGNLLANAAKYTDDGGHIEVSFELGPSRVCVHVTDNGQGIAPDMLPRVFQLFEQGRRSIERTGGGLGIGLAVVKALVELHGGQVTAHSDGEQRGARFTVALPLLRLVHVETAASLPGGALAAPSGAGAGGAPAPRVLVVDDNVDALVTLQSLLESHGYAVATTPNPAEALELALRFRPSLAVLDLGLPVIDGYELARRLREHSAEIGRLGLIALTGYGQPSDRVRTRAAGFDVHLVKPVDASTLLAALRQVEAMAS
ncbi:MAG TPA: ATP-binding protein [Burkholderiaceae bacterium]|nr:ATP-binding protein [Burkholderiaceae bacterium]